MPMLKCALLLLVGGCLAGCVNPGWQTAKGLKQTAAVEYTADKLVLSTEGSQEATWTFIEGNLAFDEEGNIDLANSHVTGYIRSEPSAEQAAGTMAVMAQLLQVQSQMVSDRIAGVENLIGALLPGLLVPAPAQESTNGD